MRPDVQEFKVDTFTEVKSFGAVQFLYSIPVTALYLNIT
jgi:hypothetical protein